MKLTGPRAAAAALLLTCKVLEAEACCDWLRQLDSGGLLWTVAALAPAQDTCGARRQQVACCKQTDAVSITAAALALAPWGPCTVVPGQPGPGQLA